MRRWLPYLLAAVLGTGAAVLAACSDSTKGGFPSDDASDLKSQIEDVRQRVDDGRCQALADQLRQVDERIDGLASSVDAQLRQRLRDGAEKMREVGRSECEENRQDRETETTTTETVPPPETTETQPPTTKTQPQPTATTPPTPTNPEPQPPPVPPSPGGGTPPELEQP